jgi:ABC-type transporter Mla maintaining outer membrane lipid asymmetry ATPase subunit MlaF
LAWHELYPGTQIMLYDEPTTGLDTATAKEISQLILDTAEI